MDLARVVGELDHRLAGRVRAADDDNVLHRALLGLDVGRRVVQAVPFESIGILGRQPAILRTRREDHRSTPDALTVREQDLAQSPGLRLGHLRRLMEAGDHRAELARLKRRPPTEIRAGEAGGKAEVVLDPSARARLTARGEAFDHQSAETLGGGVDRRGQPGRTAAEDDDVEALSVDVRSKAQLIGDRGHRGSPGDAVGPDQHWALGIPDPEPVEQDPALFVGGEIVPGEGTRLRSNSSLTANASPDHREPISRC